MVAISQSTVTVRPSKRPLARHHNDNLAEVAELLTRVSGNEPEIMAVDGACRGSKQVYPAARRAVTSISIFISGFCNCAEIIVAAGRAFAKTVEVTGQQSGHSLASGTM